MGWERDPSDARPYGRRAFLLAIAGGVSALWWGSAAAKVVGRALGPVADVVTPSEGWRIYTIGKTMPTFDAASWRLDIDGLVERPRTLTYADLIALPRAEQVSDFHCVTGWSVYGVRWAGVRFHDLLATAAPLPGGKALRFISMESPYEDSLMLEQALFPDAMLAYEMNGTPLSRAHGAPARVVMPQMYGYKGVKWVTRIEVVPERTVGFWEGLGYHPNAWIDHADDEIWHAQF
jgi:DMSO/TMAO reductase YedYZ molybdopterin-dependent catalytic subunit